MKKSLMLIAAALIASLSLAGCNSFTGTSESTGEKTESSAKTQDTTSEADEQSTDEAVEKFAKNADKNIDMDKVDGTDATTAEDASAAGTVGDTEVEITDAKVIKHNDIDTIVVSFTFKNKTGDTTTFSGENAVTAYQNQTEMRPEVIVDVEGIDCNTLMQQVDNNDTITVQKAFKLVDTENPVTVIVSPSNPADIDKGNVSKTFNIK